MFEINGETWRVVFVSPLHPQLIRSDGSSTIGACNDDTKTIYLDKTLDKYLVKKVLTHEITHAAMFSYNVDLCPRQEELVAMLIDTYGHEIINITNQFFNHLEYR
jgi:hypothetical protein